MKIDTAKLLAAIKGYPLKIMGHKADKRLLLPIIDALPNKTDMLLDLFGGTGVVSYAAKHLGIRTITNDIRRYANLQHRVLLVNNSEVLTDNDIKILLAPNPKRRNDAEKFYGTIFGKKNSVFLDTWASNIPKLPDKMKQDIAVFVATFPIINQLGYPTVRFTVTDELAGIRHYRDRNLEDDIVKYAKEVFPKLIVDNGQTNEAYQEDSIALVSKIEAQVAYVDSPYACKGGNYDRDYSFHEFLVLLLSGRASEITNAHGYDTNLPTFTHFSCRDSALMGFDYLFSNAKHIPLLLLAYNSRSDMTPEEIATIATIHGRTASIEKIKYPFPSSIKNRNREVDEVLITCKAKYSKGA